MFGLRNITKNYPTCLWSTENTMLLSLQVNIPYKEIDNQKVSCQHDEIEYLEVTSYEDSVAARLSYVEGVNDKITLCE